ncbi:MAG: prepilin-type N-terminal cleavage/methylation domain-containing protein [Candidatus Eisenbacteria bacterium]
MKRLRNSQKGFTLMELMVVIVIVAILAAVAVPLYINYVNDARDTEAKGAIGAIVTAEQTYRQVNGTYTNTKANLNVQLDQAEVNWTFTIPSADANGFTVQASGKTGRPTAGATVTYTYPSGDWTSSH